jgi:site-specific DNA recombinase
MAKLFIYTRVSTSLQTDNTSLEYQASRCKAYCEAHGHEAVEVIKETMSGKSFDDRQQAKAVIDRIMEGEADGIISLRLDRLSRSVRDILQLSDTFQKADKMMVLVENNLDTSNPMGRAVLTMMAAMSQLEREMIQERSNAGRAAKKAAGGRIGGTAPYGFDLDENGNAVRNELEHAEICTMKKMHDLGLPLHRIAADFSGRNVATKRGGKWSPATIHYILTRDKPTPTNCSK